MDLFFHRLVFLPLKQRHSLFQDIQKLTLKSFVVEFVTQIVPFKNNMKLFINLFVIERFSHNFQRTIIMAYSFVSSVGIRFKFICRKYTLTQVLTLNDINFDIATSILLTRAAQLCASSKIVNFSIDFQKRETFPRCNSHEKMKK